MSNKILLDNVLIQKERCDRMNKSAIRRVSSVVERNEEAFCDDKRSFDHQEIQILSPRENILCLSFQFVPHLGFILYLVLSGPCPV